MKHDNTEARARRGLAILAALFLAAILVFNLDVIVDLFRGYVDLVAIVTETSDVRVGASVWVEGMEVGRVTGMDLVGPTALAAMSNELAPEQRAAVALHVRLEDRAREVVRKGSRAYTSRQRVIGAPTVRIDAGPATAPPVESGDTLYPADRPTIEMLIERGKMFPSALDSLVAAVREINRLADAREPALTLLLDRVSVVTEEGAALRVDLEGGSLDQWLDDPTLGRRVDALRRRVAELSEAADGLQRYGGGELRSSAGSFAERAERLRVALDALDRRLTEGGGMASRMSRDSALLVAMEGVQAQVDSLRAEGLGFALRMLKP